MKKKKKVGRPPKKDKKMMVGCALAPDLVEWVMKSAKRQDISISSFIEEMLRRAQQMGSKIDGI